MAWETGSAKILGTSCIVGQLAHLSKNGKRPRRDCLRLASNAEQTSIWGATAIIPMVRPHHKDGIVSTAGGDKPRWRPDGEELYIAPTERWWQCP